MGTWFNDVGRLHLDQSPAREIGFPVLKIFRISFAIMAIAIAFASPLLAVDPKQKPMMVIPDQVVVREDFAKPFDLASAKWTPRQGTTWEVVDGVLRGHSSSPEFREGQKDHFGYEPRILNASLPKEFMAEFSLRMVGGSHTTISPFIAFGHHVCRLRFGVNGPFMLAAHESLLVARTKDYRPKLDEWLHIHAEQKNDEIVVRFLDGPAIYAEHDSFSEPSSSGGDGLSIAGMKDGIVEIDGLTIWSIKSDYQPGWSDEKTKLPSMKPVPFPPAGKAKKAGQ
jgi:hypothetical protein